MFSRQQTSASGTNWSAACGNMPYRRELLIAGAASAVPGRLSRTRRGLRKVVDEHNLPLTYEIKRSENVSVRGASFSRRSVLSSALTSSCRRTYRGDGHKRMCEVLELIQAWPYG